MIRRAPKDRWFTILASLLLLGLAALGGVFLYRTRAPNQAGKQDVPAAAAKQPPIPTGSEWTASVQVQARHIVTVAAPVDGFLEALEVEPGTDVYEGQILGRISNTTLQEDRDIAIQEHERAQTRLNNLESSLIAARLEASRANADAARARSEFERARKEATHQQFLHKEGATARLKMEKAVSEFESAKKDHEAIDELARQARNRVDALLKDIDLARKAVEEKTAILEQAKTALQAADVLSPVDGVFLASRARQGDGVNLLMEDLFQIAVDLYELQATVEPEPPVLARIKVGTAALVQVLDYSQDAVDAEVGSIDSKTGRVVVHFTSPSPTVRPGMAAVVKIRLP